MIDINNCKKIFEEYLKNFDFTNDDIKMKYYHTFRVLDFCTNIAKSLNLKREDIEVMQLIGLLHDIGRFEQIKSHHTFSDLNSFDHADYGVKILQTNNYIDEYVKDKSIQKIVIEAIRNHNKYSIDNNLDDRTILFCKIIRDADKLDIIEMVNKNIIKVNINGGYISDLVLKNLLDIKSIDRRNINSKIDNDLVNVAFIFDIYFEYSYNYIKNKNLEKIIIDKIIINNQHEINNLIKIKKIIELYLENWREKIC